jgi:ribosomal protein S18 acetylase RimI-like enzyme
MITSLETKTKLSRKMAARIAIRRLPPEEARAYRGLLVEGLITHPTCFMVDYQDEATRPISEVEQRIASEQIWGVWCKDDLIGTVAFVQEPIRKRRHIGSIRDLYIREPFRRAGIAQQLLAEVLEQAARRVDQVEVAVAESNPAAILFYETCGFSKHAILPRGLRIENMNYNLQIMIKSFR